MRYLIVNLDNQQYFRPVELGAPHGSKYGSVADAQGPYDWPWLIFLSQMLESPSEAYLNQTLGPLYGAWAGDRIAIVRGDDETGAFLPEDLQALKALGADVKDYKFIRENYQDRTDELKKTLPTTFWGRHTHFQRITQPQDYGWLTVKAAKERINFARSKGSDYHRDYLRWLLGRLGVRPEVQALVRKEMARLDRDSSST
jgi:hypothetical protein